MQANKPLADWEKISAIIAGGDGETAPGCAVALFREGRAEFVYAGLANIEAGRRPDADTLYYAGSLAKQFTALAVVQLVLAGRIDLNADVRGYLPEMPR